MGARRRRLTTTKKKKAKKNVATDAPTPEEWASMELFGSFSVIDNDDEDFVFKKGDIALIQPENTDPSDDLDLCEYWVGKIKEIRRRQNENEVFAQVQWYWSGHDVAQLIKSFDASCCGRYERILSDQFDVVSSFCFSDIATLKNYNETNLQQEPIGEEEFFSRYRLEHRRRAVTPKPKVTCICSVPYNPDDPDPMHFCPRPGCRKAYHRHCLVKGGFVRKDRSTRPWHFLAVSPDDDDVLSLNDLVCIPESGRRPKGQFSKLSPAVEDIIASLPKDIVRIAQSPMVKGGDNDDVTGNISSVVAARRMLYAVLKGDDLPADWSKQLDLEWSSPSLSADKPFPSIVCPNCKSPI